MKLRNNGRTKLIVSSSIDAALLAVEIFNKPRTAFRVENYVMLMIVAWTRMFHAHFNLQIGDKYYYKDKNKRYTRINGEKQAWDLSRCIKEFKKLPFEPPLLSKGIEANLNLFITHRNKIEHKHIEKRDLEAILFGELQSLLFNYETMLTNIFGDEYALQEALSFSLQFSTVRGNDQARANKRSLSQEYKDLKTSIEKYRGSLSQDTLDSQEYSIKVLLIPRVSNTKANDVSVQFVASDKNIYDDVIAVIDKEKIKKVEVVNINKFKPAQVVEKINCSLNKVNFKIHIHTYLVKLFEVRPYDADDNEKFETKSKYCIYDEPHNTYIYTEPWIDLIQQVLSDANIDEIETLHKKKIKLAPEEYNADLIKRHLSSRK